MVYRKSTHVPKSKRWYVDASIPKAVPFIGGSSFKAGSGTLSKRSLDTMIKRAGETKQKIYTGGASVAMTQNTIYSFNPLGNIPIGTGANSRIGSSIFVKSFDINLLLSNYGATLWIDTVSFRIMLVKIDQEYLSGTDTLAAGVGSTDIFVASSAQMLNSHIDKNKAHVLYDQTHTLENNGAGSACVTQKPVRLSLLKDKSFKYSSHTSNYSNYGNYYLLVMPYVVGKASGTSIIADVRYESVVNFSDA
jgi:hypothetical protein